MVSGIHERAHHHSADFVLIKQDDKFFTRLLSKESNAKGGESSFRYYSSGSIPFLWESQPGTPKHKLSSISLPPLTPPPSYQTNAQLKSLQKQSKPKFLLSIFSKRVTSSLASPSVSSSSCSSSFSISRNYRWRSDEECDPEKLQMPDSPTSTLCFGCSRMGMGNSKRTRVKKAISSIAGNGAS